MSTKVKKIDNLEGALKILNKVSDVSIVAGGTDLIPRKHRGLLKSEMYLCISDIPELRVIKKNEDSGFFIGAGIKLIELVEESQLNVYTSLLQAAGSVASHQIRNQGTIGGNILQENRCMYYNTSISWRRDLDACYKLGGNKCFQHKNSPECVALLQSDLAPVLVSYGAVAVLVNSNGEREVPLNKFYFINGNKDIFYGDLLIGVKIPLFSKKYRSAYTRETIRGTFDFPIISCAILISVEKNIIREAHIVLGSAASYPRVIVEAEEILTGKNVNDVAIYINEIKKISRKYVLPFKDTRTEGKARRLMAENVIERGLLQVCK